VVEKMKGFALAGAINELMVKPEDRHAYDHKLNLFYLFTPRQNQGLIDTFGEEQLSLLYKQRYFQKLRQLIQVQELPHHKLLARHCNKYKHYVFTRVHLF
jgi:hypothetical protein